MNETTLTTKISILSKLYLTYGGKYDNPYQDVFDFSNLGLTYSYSVENNLIELTDKITPFIEDSFDFLLETIGIEDTGFGSLEEVTDQF